MKNKKCKHCKATFVPIKPLQVVCGYNCGLLYAKANRLNAEKKDTKQRIEKLKSKSDWLREAQSVFNSYIRERDSNLPCVSCGKHHTGQYHAGHYLSVGSHPELRFAECNVHKQCSVCNNHLSGNQIEYRKNLILKIGINDVEWMESKHEAKKYTIDDIKEIKEVYRLKLKQLKSLK